MKAKDVYKTVSSRLQDLTPPRRWPWESPIDYNTPSLQDFLNNALLNVALQRPDSTATIKTLTLVEGPMQQLEEEDLSLLECIRNTGGRAVTRIDRSEMDSYLVDWYEDDASFDGVWNWSYERTTNPLVYWVYPAVPSGHTIEAVTSIRPALIDSPEDDLNISPLFKSALDSWVLFEVMASDTDGANWEKAIQYFQSFGQVLGVKMEIDMRWPIKMQRNEGVNDGS